MQLISKTTFLSYLGCRKDTWLRIHRPDEVGEVALSDFERHILEQGNEVEAEARKRFPDGVLVTATEDAAVEETARLVEARTPVIFQATFVADGFFIKCDVLVYDAARDTWDLYEVKGTNSVKEGSSDTSDHISDLAFQRSVLARAGMKIGRCFLICLDKEYVRSGQTDLDKLFKHEDVTDKVAEKLPEIEALMQSAQEYLLSETEPEPGCGCVYKGRSGHCPSFALSNPHVPDYSVHDLSGIRSKKLGELLGQGILRLEDIPDGYELSASHLMQVMAQKQGEPLIDKDGIAAELNALRFPLYFFDYEAFGPAVPAFDGYRPYAFIPFQFSLHVLRTPEGPLEHVEFLHEELSDPTEQVAHWLREHASEDGTVIVWHKTFEKMINSQAGLRLPGHAGFFEEFNGRIYDLKDVFAKNLYVHPGFKGRTSIKKVLPVIAPDLSYDELGIREGGQASDAWWRMVGPDTSPEEKERIARDLKIYCGLDTYAMYAIWHHLQEIVSDSAIPRSPYAPIHG